MEERGKRMCQLLWHHDTIEWGPTSPCASSAEGMWRGWNLGAQPARGDVVREEPWSACTPLSAVAWRLPSTCETTPNMPNGLGREQVGEVRAGAADVGPTARAACDARRRRCMADEPPRPARVRRPCRCRYPEASGTLAWQSGCVCVDVASGVAEGCVCM